MSKIKEFIDTILCLPLALKVTKNELKDKKDINRIPRGLTEWRPRSK